MPVKPYRIWKGREAMKKIRFLLIPLTALTLMFACPAGAWAASAAGYVGSDTGKSISRPQYDTYQFKFTVYGSDAVPKITVGNGKVLKADPPTVSADRKGNLAYYVRVQAIGTPGTSSGVYTALPGQEAVKQCIVRVTEKTVPFRNLYAGFVLENNTTLKLGGLPTGDVLLDTKKDWDAFESKYLKNSADLEKELPSSIDFAKDSVLYHSDSADRQNSFAAARPADLVAIVDRKPVLREKDFGDGFRVTTANYSFAEYRYVVLVLLKKADLPS